MKRIDGLRAFVAVSIFLSAMMWPVVPAHAVCTNLGGIVTCTADDANGFLSAADLTSLTVNNGVTVSDTTGGNGAAGGFGVAVIELGDIGVGATDITGAFINNGFITDTGVINNGLFVEGFIGGGFVNNGTISAGIDGVSVGDTISGGFVNNGTLTGTFFGANLVDISGGFTNTGTIAGTNLHGVSTSDITGGFFNSGSITGGLNGVDTTDIFGGFNNSGTITGANNGLDTFDIFGGFINSGSITGTGNDGINTVAITGGFRNSGNITGNDDAVDTGDVSGGFNNTGTLLGVTGEGANINGSVSGGFNNGGTIRSTGSDAIDISGSLTGDFSNSGTITGSGPAGDGVDIAGSLTGNVLNSGTITGTDDGFDVDGALIGNFTNTGLISATGLGTDRNAVDLSSITGRFLNTGNIIGANDGVSVEAGTVAGGFSNRGRIVGDSDGNGTGDGVEIISAAGQSAGFSNEFGATITGVIGFHSEAGDETLTNDGTITGTGGTSIDLGAGNDRLNLLPNSILIGLIDMGTGANALDVARGLNLAATFTGSIPGTINTNGALLIINGNQVVVIDASAFPAAGQYLGDLTNSIFNAVDGSAEIGPAGPLSTAALGFGEAPNIPPASAIHVWASGFGGQSRVSAKNLSADHKHDFGGAIAGIEKRMSDQTFGFFGGGAWSRLATGTPAQDTNVTTVLGGVYYKRDFGGHWLNMMLSAGWSGHDFQRRIANNLAPTGIEFADSDFNGLFLAPAVTVGMPIPNTTATASLRVNYAGLFLESYKETGARSSLTFAGRDIHMAGARAQLAMPVVSHFQNGASTRLEARVGADGQFSIGSDSIGASIGTGSVQFSTGEIDRISGFAGLDLSHSTLDGRNEFKASIEALTTFDGDYRINGQFKAIHRF